MAAMHYFVSVNREAEHVASPMSMIPMAILKAYRDGDMLLCASRRVTKAEWARMGWNSLQLTKQQAICPFCR